MLSHEEKTQLLQIAKASVAYGLQHGKPLPVDLNNFPEKLRNIAATFVTLKINHELRGCIGTLTANQPLVQDVAEHAYAAAFRDPRFPALTQNELEKLDYHISILSEPETVEFKNEKDLLEQIRPGIDGLVFEEGLRRATFLPAVWESLPEPVSFLQNLKLKAGLSPSYWSDTVKIQKYTVEEF